MFARPREAAATTEVDDLGNDACRGAEAVVVKATAVALRSTDRVANIDNVFDEGMGRGVKAVQGLDPGRPRQARDERLGEV